MASDLRIKEVEATEVEEETEVDGTAEVEAIEEEVTLVIKVMDVAIMVLQKITQQLLVHS